MKKGKNKEPVEESINVCLKCGKPIVRKEKFCMQCGIVINLRLHYPHNLI
ncbi:MAG: zinc-ribbon domain-containing protein [Candidatus Heimdallarchaeota archaeon]|nr:zinc-ribbon domain-containing protein [Candidatus Heimdallarchaeota archaeon]